MATIDNLCYLYTYSLLWIEDNRGGNPFRQRIAPSMVYIILQGRRNGVGGASAPSPPPPPPPPPPHFETRGAEPPLPPFYHMPIYYTKYINIVLNHSKNCCQNASEMLSESRNFQNFLGEHAPRPVSICP